MPLALVGLMQVGPEAHALIEHPELGVARIGGVGGIVFGHKVVEIAPGTVILQREGATTRLTLGARKIEPKVEALGDPLGLGLSDPRNAQLAELPSNVLVAISRVLPKGGELRRVRAFEQGGVQVYQVEKQVDGLRQSVRVAEDGRLLRVERQLRHASLPAVVRNAANRAIDGFVLNESDTPSFQLRDGAEYYEIEVREEGGREELDLQISADGRVIGIDD